ncbi:MAG: sulfatase-like hydrolase/transferase [Planctomycetaceae bacterium]|nr:sulfatase-like hydrolase/transferase [Planctomycetaceae bacterium]
MSSVQAIIAFLGALVALSVPTFAAERLPNIVFLLADDLGYGDLACCGHPYARTPNLDRLAREGTRFQQFCVTGITCCPSRTGFMTSKFPATFKGYPANAGFGERVTVTDLLKQAGYATGHFGKWHIGPETKSGTYGIDDISSGEAGGRRKSDRGRDAPIYAAAIQFIEQHKDGPFYVNVWGHITHNPVNPPQSYADRFKDVTVNEADFPPPMREKFAIAKSRGGDISVGMRNYLGDVFSLDEEIGRLLKRLDELGLSDNTIVVFSSDHGSPSMRPPGEDDAAPKKKKAKKKNQTSDSGADLTLNLMGFNGGLRGGKHGMYEGGVRVPFLIRWPGHVPAGRIDQQSVISGIDWLPTLCRIAGVKINASDFDGEDVSQAWFGQATHTRTKPLFWKVSNPGAPVGIRDGQWKLHFPNRKRGEVELYDLANDRVETTNVATKHPDVVQRLTARAKQWDATLPTEYEKTEEQTK